MGNSVLWIRNDFRFHDNTALINAINDIKDNENLIFIYHLDPELIKIETTSYAYFFSSLNSYYESCLKKGLDIYFLYGEILTCFDTLLNEFSNIDKIYYNIIECGYGKSQEQKLNRFLKRKNIEVFSFYDHHLHPANEVLKEDNSHYKVFTHYYNKWMGSKKPEEQNIDYAKLSEIILSDFSKKDPIGKEKFIELRNLLNNDFSKADKDNAEVRKAHNYVSTPNGSLKEYNYQTKKETNISNSLPSDPADPARQNLITPTNIPLEKQRALNSKQQSQKPKFNSAIILPSFIVVRFKILCLAAQIIFQHSLECFSFFDLYLFRESVSCKKKKSLVG